ncbi:MAG: ATP-dependent sacrificial sulfur transferase LarE [Thermodesulfobacteriota bacterium]
MVEYGTVYEKKDLLYAMIRRFDSLLVAFSGGADSTLLLAAAREVLQDRVVAITAVSAIHPMEERNHAVETAFRLGARHILHETSELTIPEFAANPKNRCYICKQYLFAAFRQVARNMGLAAVAHGVTMDDLNDYRPGLMAAAELGIAAPLVEAGLTKAEVRRLSREMSLPTWNRPAMACLATRVPYGTPITEETLRSIGLAERILLDQGFSMCRVRHHGEIARIEVPAEEIGRLLDGENRLRIVAELKKLGFAYVVCDLTGYVSGSMNHFAR